MPSNLALIIWIGITVILLRIENRSMGGGRWTLWIPTVWLLLGGSRPLGRWFPEISFAGSVSAEEGSAADRIILVVLVLLSLLVVRSRGVSLLRVAKSNFWLFALYFYIGLSVIWSDYSFVSFKRWIRAVGPVFVGIILLTENEPKKAFERILRRTCYILIPMSPILIHYFPYLGRQYNRWSGEISWTGVALQKNALAQLCAVSIVFIGWCLLKDWKEGSLFVYRWKTAADCLVVGLSLYLLRGPFGSWYYSVTSTIILIIGMIIVTSLMAFPDIQSHLVKRIKLYSLILVGTFLLFYPLFVDSIVPVLGRDDTLTGRTQIWASLETLAWQRPILGLGYGSFWGLEPALSLNLGVGQAHNGYLDVFLQLGVVGLILLASFMLACLNQLRESTIFDKSWTAFVFSIMIMEFIYNNSESSFLLPMSFLWLVFIFAILITSMVERDSMSAQNHDQLHRVFVNNRHTEKGVD